MRKIFSLLFTLIILKANAQKKADWQIIFEINGMKSNNMTDNYRSPSYRLLDSSASLFKKYNTNLTTQVTSKIKAGINVGIRYNYPINRFLMVNAGLIISRSAVERSIQHSYKIEDSATTTLQGTGPNWFDPANGMTIVWYPGIGYAASFRIVTLLNFQNHQFKYRNDGVEKINFTAIEIPLGITLNSGTSNFSFNLGISPVFAIGSYANIDYEKNNEIQFNNLPEYHVTKLMWRLGAGISYKINKAVEAGLSYKQQINSVVEYDDIKLRSVGLQVLFKLPLKK